MVKRMAALKATNWQLDTDHHGGGFARSDPRLLRFVTDFGDNTGLLLEPVYTGKAMLALQDLIIRSAIPRDSRVLFIHSGGMQGRRGFQ